MSTSVMRFLKDLRTDKIFSDVTLVCDDEYFNAHKIVLAANSEFFRKLFINVNQPHPVIVLKDVIKAFELEALLDFMYTGEIGRFSEKNLEFLIIKAKYLKIDGFVEYETDNKEKRKSFTTGVGLGDVDGSKGKAKNISKIRSLSPKKENKYSEEAPKAFKKTKLSSKKKTTSLEPTSDDFFKKIGQVASKKDNNLSLKESPNTRRTFDCASGSFSVAGGGVDGSSSVAGGGVDGSSSVAGGGVDGSASVGGGGGGDVDRSAPVLEEDGGLPRDFLNILPLLLDSAVSLPPARNRYKPGDIDEETNAEFLINPQDSSYMYCFFCLREYRSPDLVTTHINNVHINGQFECRYCKKKVKSHKKLVDHALEKCRNKLPFLLLSTLMAEK